ncbi:MAG TPA: RDD family protein [Candidatus Acidoferrales bacterium]|nr:RDD family protein [Candidatus Acidoferrales bacterium]
MENIRDSRLPFGETSAAQNGTVIKTCQQCGAVNGDPSDVCCFCDAPLGGSGHTSISRRVTTLTEGNLAVQSEWRREVSSKLEDYRARRRGGASAGLQTALPFDPGSDTEIDGPSPVATEVVSPVRAKKTSSTRAKRTERFEIAIPQLQAASAARYSPWPDAAPAVLPQAPLTSAASLPERRRAAVVDLGLLLFSYGGMLALFSVLGGRIGFNRVDLTLAAATFALFYTQYFALFTVFGGSTPGMMLRGLRVVSFDGRVPTSRQMVWRSAGYAISAATCCLGFIWALWDDDRLCWHDRISHTYLAPIEENTRY